jgi:hypothetical protein
MWPARKGSQDRRWHPAQGSAGEVPATPRGNWVTNASRRLSRDMSMTERPPRTTRCALASHPCGLLVRGRRIAGGTQHEDRRRSPSGQVQLGSRASRPYLTDRCQWETIASAFPAISCLDQADFGLKHARQEWPHEIASGTQHEDRRRSPSGQVQLGSRASRPYLTDRCHPQSFTSATPYEQATWMAGQLKSGVLLTWRGSGHSAWELGNQSPKPPGNRARLPLRQVTASTPCCPWGSFRH